MTIRFLDAPQQTLQHAVLIYADAKGNTASVTIHPVAHGPQGARIAAGRPATRRELARLLDVTRARKQSPAVHFLPATVLAAGADYLVWWCPPQRRAVWFNSPESILGQRQAIVPHPGLVFVAMPKAKVWNVFAVKGMERPTPETPLYQAPYFNVWEDGRICEGNVATPKTATPGDIAAWEDAFFRSEFTHANVGQRGRLVRGRRKPDVFWQALLDGKYRRFPERVLVALPFRLAQLLSAVANAKKKSLTV